MRIERALKIRDAAIMRYRDAASHTVHFGLSHAEYLAEIKPIFDDMWKLSVPRHVIAYVRGYERRTVDSWYESKLVWCRVSPDGGYYSAHVKPIPSFTESVDSLYQAGRGAEVATWPHGHYWIDASLHAVSYGRSPKPF